MSETERLHDVQAAIEAGKAIEGVREVACLGADSGDAVVEVHAVHKDYRLETVDLEQYYSRPGTMRGTATFILEHHFIAYVNAFKTEATRIFADFDGTTATAVIDYHTGRWPKPGAKGDGEGDGDASNPVPEEEPKAGWGRHRAKFQPPKDPDWEAWLKYDGQPMDQLDFAMFLEEHAPNVMEPTAAELMELALDLEETNTTTFRSSHRLRDGGRELVYQDDADQKNVKVPEDIKLRLRVFRQGELYELVAKLRFRTGNGQARLFYQLQRPQDVLDKAFGDCLDGINVETRITPWHGTAPSQQALAGEGSSGPF